MFFVYEVPNRNPALGPIKGDQQQVSVYDHDLGNRRNVITTPEEADTFIETRKTVINDAAKRGWGLAGLATLGGGAVGAAVNHYIDVKEAKKLNTLIDPLNQAFKEILASGKSTLFAKSEALSKDAFKKNYFKLSELFSEDAKMFTNIDVKAVAKSAMKSGAAIGAGLAACFAIAIPFIKADNADAKVTKEFIDYNK